MKKQKSVYAINRIPKNGHRDRATEEETGKASIPGLYEKLASIMANPLSTLQFSCKKWLLCVYTKPTYITNITGLLHADKHCLIYSSPPLFQFHQQRNGGKCLSVPINPHLPSPGNRKYILPYQSIAGCICTSLPSRCLPRTSEGLSPCQLSF